MAVKKKSAVKAKAKAKVTKVKVKKKSKTDKAYQREVDRLLADFDEATDARYEYAMKFYKAQDKKTKAAITGTVEVMKRMAGPPSARVTTKFDKTPVQINIDPRLQEKNLLYCAIRLFVNLAEMDIQLADFEFPKKVCLTCGKSVGKKAK